MYENTGEAGLRETKIKGVKLGLKDILKEEVSENV